MQGIDFFNASSDIVNSEEQFNRPTYDFLSHAPMHSPTFRSRPNAVDHPGYVAVPFHVNVQQSPTNISRPSPSHAIFGLDTELAERDGWFANLLIVSVSFPRLRFVQTFSRFLAVRGPFGVRMGGICGFGIRLCSWIPHRRCHHHMP